MWPHTFGSVFSAQNARTFRRNAIFMPLYPLIMLFAFFVGFAAILSVSAPHSVASELLWLLGDRIPVCTWSYEAGQRPSGR